VIFLTGANSKFEDILKWFISNYNAHIPKHIPLYIVDFGLSKKYPNSFKIPKKRFGINPWFYKPRAIQLAPAEQVCWIDCDIEIKADISDVFKILEDSNADVCLTKDVCNSHCEWATGLVCLNKNKSSNLLSEWITLSESRRMRGDQEAFAKISSNYNIHQLPAEYQWLRLQEPNSNAKAIHWTGVIGKKHIRSNLIHI